MNSNKTHVQLPQGIGEKECGCRSWALPAQKGKWSARIPQASRQGILSEGSSFLSWSDSVLHYSVLVTHISHFRKLLNPNHRHRQNYHKYDQRRKLSSLATSTSILSRSRRRSFAVVVVLEPPTPRKLMIIFPSNLRSLYSRRLLNILLYNGDRFSSRENGYRGPKGSWCHAGCNRTFAHYTRTLLPQHNKKKS